MSQDTSQYSGIPTSVRRFVLEYLFSVEQLEILLLLAAFPQKEWRAGTLSSILRTNVNSAAKRLNDLEKAKLIQKIENLDEPSYQISSNAITRQYVEELSQIYKTHRIKIIELIYSRPRDAVRNFANAFRFRGEE